MKIAICTGSEATVHSVARDDFDAAIYQSGGLIIILLRFNADREPFKKISGLLWAGRGAHKSGLPCFIFTKVEWEEALKRLKTIHGAQLIEQEHAHHSRQ